MTDDEPNPWAEIVGPCYTERSMARTLGWTELEVMDAGADLRLLMLRTEDGVYLFPAFQLLGGQVVEGLAEVLHVLQTGTVGSWTWAQWLNVTLPDDGPPRNIQRLYEERLDETIRDAKHVAWAWGS